MCRAVLFERGGIVSLWMKCLDTRGLSWNPDFFSGDPLTFPDTPPSCWHHILYPNLIKPNGCCVFPIIREEWAEIILRGYLVSDPWRERFFSIRLLREVYGDIHRQHWRCCSFIAFFCFCRFSLLTVWTVCRRDVCCGGKYLKGNIHSLGGANGCLGK